MRCDIFHDKKITGIKQNHRVKVSNGFVAHAVIFVATHVSKMFDTLDIETKSDQ